MRSSLPGLRFSLGMALAALLSLSTAQADTTQANTTPQQGAAAEQTATLSPASQTSARTLSCDTLLETASYQQAMLQSVIEKRAAAQEAGQLTPDLDQKVYESQARLDQTQGQINTVCSA